MMIQACNFIPIGENGQELRRQGTPLFPCSAYAGNVHGYFASQIPYHWHKELELFLLLEGKANVHINHDIYPMQAGEGCFINAEMLHSIVADADVPCYYHSFVFDPFIVTGSHGSIFDVQYIRPLITSKVPFVPIRQGEKASCFLQRFEQTFCHYAEEGYGWEFQVRNGLSELLLMIHEEIPNLKVKQSNSIQQDRVKQLLQWIEEHFSQPVTVNELAKDMNLSTRACQRIFKEYLHSTPIAYLHKRRILYATELLLSTSESITSIAMECGFESPAYFSKIFKRISGCLPSEYRKQYQSHV